MPKDNQRSDEVDAEIKAFYALLEKHSLDNAPSDKPANRPHARIESVPKPDDNQSTDSVLDWMRSNRLFEESLFFYLLIIVFWGMVALFTLGFEIQGLTPVQNLAANFAYTLLLGIAMALTPLWYRLIFNRGSHLQKRIANIDEKVAAITDPRQKQAVERHLATTGQLPVRKKQQWALVFIGWCALFEMFFVSSWVRDMALVWQPDWVNAVIDWVRDNTKRLDTQGPEVQKLFNFYLQGAGDSAAMLRQHFSDAEAFLYSPFGEACLLFQAWRALSFFPILAAVIICLWEMIGWTGSSNLENKSGCMGTLWLVIVTFFMTLLLIAGTGIHFTSIGYRAISVTGLTGWASQFWLNIAYIFIIIALRLYVNWFNKGKRLWARLFG